MTPYLPDGVSQEQYPFTGKFLTLKSGPRMHYLDEGSGRPVVMIHGNPSWSFYYRDLVLALRDHSRAIAPDHIGCGLSDKPGEANTITPSKTAWTTWSSFWTASASERK